MCPLRVYLRIPWPSLQFNHMLKMTPLPFQRIEFCCIFFFPKWSALTSKRSSGGALNEVWVCWALFAVKPYGKPVPSDCSICTSCIWQVPLCSAGYFMNCWKNHEKSRQIHKNNDAKGVVAKEFSERMNQKLLQPTLIDLVHAQWWSCTDPVPPKNIGLRRVLHYRSRPPRWSLVSFLEPASTWDGGGL